MNMLKFRIWDKTKKRYVTDNLAITPSGLIVEVDDDLCGQANISNNQDNYIIQQWTGLTDSYGKDIYEGDIITETHYDSWGDKVGFSYYGIVTWVTCEDTGDHTHLKTSGFRTYASLENKGKGAGLPLSKYCAIIGNELENPEFLKSKSII